MSHNSADISKAEVQEVVSRALLVPVFCSIQLWHRFVKTPSPHIFLFSTAC